MEMTVRWLWRLSGAWVACALVASGASSASAARPHTCKKMTLTGEAAAGQEWRAVIGQGWVFRVVPIQPGENAGRSGYSGWDLVVDREPPAGFPDALLVASAALQLDQRARGGDNLWPACPRRHWVEPAQLPLPDRSRSISREPAAVSDLRECKRRPGRACGEQPGREGDPAPVEDQRKIGSRAISDSGCEAGGRYCRCRSLRGEVGPGFRENATHHRALDGRRSHSAGRTEMDQVLDHTVASGRMEGSPRTSWRERGLSGVKNVKQGVGMENWKI